MRKTLAGLAVPALLLWAGPAAAGPAFGLPIDCEPGRTCFIQNHVDHDPGPGWSDYACGRLSYDGDTGTDFRLPDYVAMDRGVAVLAAADGVVVNVRDGMADVSVRTIGLDAVRGREAGNRVAVLHGGGWLTQYNHLKRGSLKVKEGDRVTAGQPIAEVGLSGKTEFPHVEFLVMHNDRPVDPFVGAVPFRSCQDPRQPLWTAAALERLAYRPTGLLGAGFATTRPDPEAARQGRHAALPRAGETALFFWTDLFGGRRGDRQRLRILGPGGRVLLDSSGALDRDLASVFVAGPAALPAGGLAPGTYQGSFTLHRDGALVIEARRDLTVAP